MQFRAGTFCIDNVVFERMSCSFGFDDELDACSIVTAVL